MEGEIHPTYPNPTVRDATCEIRFGYEGPWDRTWYSKFYDVIRLQFPVNQPIALQELDAAAQQMTFMPGMRYNMPTRNIAVQLTNDRVAVNLVSDYPGWETVHEYIRFAWQTAYDIIQPTTVLRVGLRYINLISRPSDHETLEGWLIPSDLVPLAVIRSRPNFLARIQTRTDAQHLLTLTLTDQGIEVADPNPFVFDLDCSFDQETPADIDGVLRKAAQLHDSVWRAFSAAKGEQLEKFLLGDIL